jgi:hypothetical protein
MDRHHRAYRVVYRDGERTRVLGRLPAEGAPTHYTLDPFLSRLLLAGVEDGELLLVDAATGRVVARRAVRRPPRRCRDEAT